MAETWPNNGDSSELSELEIVSAALSGDAGAMEQLLAKSEAPLRTALAGQIAQPFQAVLDVDDVIQVTFIEAFLRIGQFTDRGPGSFLAWLTTLARNNLRDAIKALRAEKRIPRHRMVSVGAESDSYEGLLAQLGSTTTTPSGVAAGAESRRLVDEALAKLPPDYEKVVRLMDIDGNAAPKAASEMNRSVGAVYMLRVRAHAHLREILGNSGRFFSSGT